MELWHVAKDICHLCRLVGSSLSPHAQPVLPGSDIDNNTADFVAFCELFSYAGHHLYKADCCQSPKHAFVCHRPHDNLKAGCLQLTHARGSLTFLQGVCSLALNCNVRMT